MEILPIFSIKEFKASDEEFYVNHLDEHLEKHHFIHAPHKHDFYICVLFTEGRGKHDIDFKSYDINPGSIFFLKPGVMHHWTFTESAKGFIFFHSKAFYDLNFQNRKLHDFPFYFSIYNPPYLSLNQEQLKKTQTLFKLLYTEEKEDAYTAIKRASIIDIIYIELARLYRENKNTKVSKPLYLLKLQDFENLVEMYYIDEKSPQFYAEKLNISLKHLNRIVKETLKITASKFIADKVILEAKKLLIHSDYRVVEVANELGYDDHSYFIRLFKKHTGSTPSKFNY